MTPKQTLGLFFLILPFFLQAQAWVAPDGKLYTKFSYGAITAKEQYAFDGQKLPYAENVEDNAFFDRSFYLYSEYGIHPKLTVIANIPYKRTIIRDAAYLYRTFAFGNAYFGARYDLRDPLNWQNSSQALALNLGINIPTGYTRNYTPSVGTGQLDAQASLSYGKSFYPAPHYAQTSLGFRYRSNLYNLSKSHPCQEGVDINCFKDAKPDFENEFFFQTEFGTSVKNTLLLQALVGGNFSIRKPEVGFSITNPFPTRQRYVKAGVGATYYPIKGLGIGAQTYMTPFGRSTINSVDIFLGIEYSLN